MGLEALALEREHHVICVEIARRREHVARMKSNALAQREGVDEAVLGDFPAFGEGGLDVGGARGELHKLVVDLPARGIEGRARGIERGIEALWRAFRAIDE